MSSFFTDDGQPCAGQKVCLATTVYDRPDASYTYSIQRSREALHKAGIETAYFLLQGNCHVDDGRNRIVQEFLISDCTDLVFLDADVSWPPEALVRLCSHDEDVVGAVYPFRRDGKREDMPVRMIENIVIPDARGLMEVEGLPTGFLRIRRHVLETLEAESEAFWNRHDRRRKIPIIFERTFDGSRRWGGDLTFCNKWRAKGGAIYADYETVLGHTATAIIRDSLGATLRRNAHLTLKHVCERIRAGVNTLEDYTEARRYMGNTYGALEDVIAVCVRLAREADGPIVETGSGLTTILMAAATEHEVWGIEHHPRYAMYLEELIRMSGQYNVKIVQSPIVDGWYSLDLLEKIPERFALGLNDGPPRIVGNRERFMQHLGPRCQAIVCDDADDEQYRSVIDAWSLANGMDMTFIPPRTALLVTRNPETTADKAA